ncbi:hypothetical protein SERLADRAFT_414184 [Serpula lacrymans var. lacrymans S7.9]|uniref:DDE-1 domain-containing protein n=1 Tax=Serpula lacrymans var. lacrymans (strain S7.9) TaxID=578457 RepID=F8NN75_SERL9|nr:uncharacterized protein SERLADRAFT_414184 [Serpula lacrymans var. lacrymans S7.9]EGO27996.1 hypothetical protein SERLADRAFT_414184 [Serpula lacrymans var. lacrymans S7.9]
MELKSNTSDNISRIKYLSKLFKSLPDDLPLNPASSRYRFGLDGEELEENGHWYALNHNLEICFQAHSLRGEPLKITERGKSLDTLLKMLQDGMREAPGDAELIMNWVERLIAAAMVSGAKNVKQTSKRKMAFSSSDEGSAAQPAIKTALKKRGPTRKARDRLPVKGTAVTPITIVDDTDTSSDTETTAPRVHSEPLRARETAKPKMPRLVALDDSDDEHDGDDVDDGELPKPVRKRQSTLFAFSGFKKLSKAEADEQNRREMAETRQEAEDERVREAMVRNLRETQKREGARERKRKSRFSKKAKEIRSGKRNSAGKIMKKLQMVLGHETPAAGVPDLSDLAELSRPGKIWKKGRNVKLKGTIQNRHSRTNWYHPYLWVHINNVASRVAWSPTFIWMECVYIPYVNKIIRDEELPEDQKSILFIDCYPVHTGEEFRNYCRHHHPNVFVIYVPANCTGIYQPADVGLQRVTKHALKQESLNFLVESHRQQLAGGLKPEAVRFTHSLPVLRDATVAPAVHVYDMFKQGKGPELVRKAWSKCQVKQWCLSPEVIQHRDTKAALRKYLQDHPTFKAEIDAKIGDVYGIDSEHVNPEDDFNNEGADMDDSEVPIGSVIQEALGNGLGCMPFSAAGHGIASSEHTAVHDGGFLRGLAEGDDIWAWNVDGTRISTLP